MNRKESGEVVPFPKSRPRSAEHPDQARFLGYSAFATLLGTPREQTTGHWCSRCQGIWCGYLLEVACPKCGNRHG